MARRGGDWRFPTTLPARTASICVFHKDLLPYISPLRSFLSQTGFSFLINAYSFFAYKVNSKWVSLDYVLFESNSGVVNPSPELKYDNMLHVQVDAMRLAISVAGGPDNGSGRCLNSCLIE